MPDTLLFVDDDRFYRAEAVRHFRRLNLTVLEAADTEQAIKCLEQQPIDLVILDIGLGKMAATDDEEPTAAGPACEGYGLLQVLNARTDFIPVIVLTSLDAPIYEIASLEIGAEDYVLKSVDCNVLSARIKACLNRAKRFKQTHPPASEAAQPTKSPSDSVIEVGDFRIDVSNRLVQVCRGPYVYVSEREAQLLKLMVKSPGKVYDKHELLELLWGIDTTVEYDSVDALIKNLRRKIEPEEKKYKYLVSCRGLGYRFNPGLWDR